MPNGSDERQQRGRIKAVGYWFESGQCGSSGSCMLGDEASMDQTCSACLTDARSDWGLGNLQAWSTPWALYWGSLPSCSVFVMRVCT